MPLSKPTLDRQPPPEGRSRIDDPAPNGAGTGREPIFAPPQGLVLRAIGRGRWLIALCAIALCLVGVAFGLARQPVYTSSATLQVGQVNPNSPGFLGYVQSASALATAFARAIAAEPVLAAVERNIGVPADQAIPRLTSEPIPLSPAFRVIATGSSAAGAMALANATAHGVVVYESRANSSNPQANILLGQYQKASIAFHEAEGAVSRLQSKPGNDQSRLQAEARRGGAKVKLQAIENAYVAAITSQAPRTGLVSILATATSAGNDKKSKTELYALLGLLGGAVIGCLLAVMRERRRVSRVDGNGVAVAS